MQRNGYLQNGTAYLFRMQRDGYLGISFFVHPIPLLAVGVLFLNDQYLKHEFSSWWTGKLSDFAGVFFLPIFLLAIGELVWQQILRRKESIVSLQSLTIAVAIADLGFGLIKCWAPADRLYEQTLFALGARARNTMDVTDLLALAMNPLTYFYMRRHVASSAAP